MKRFKGRKLELGHQPKQSDIKDQPQRRQIIRPNQIIITDFSFCEPPFQKRRKRYPLFMLHKKQLKKQQQQENQFTKSGIFLQTVPTNHEQLAWMQQSRKHTSKSSHRNVLPSKSKNKLLPHNFLRAKTTRQNTSSYQTIAEVPLLQVCTSKRYVESASTRRKDPVPKSRNDHRRTFSHRRSQKAGLKDVDLYELGGWKTIDVDYDEYI